MAFHNPLYLEKKGYQAREDRLFIADMVGSEGVLGSSDLQPTLTGGLGASISAGRCYVQGDDQPNQGVYRFFSDAAWNISFLAPVTNPRIDMIIARVQDSDEVGLGPDIAMLDVVAGAPTTGANLTNLNGAPALNAIPTAMPVCYFHVPISGAIVGFKDLREICLRTDWKPGDMKFVGYSTPDPGWIVADGTPQSRTVQSLLFKRFGTTHGAGDGTTTFGIPDLRGRTAVGVDGAAARLASNDALGQAGGEESHILTIAELAVHSHNMQPTAGWTVLQAPGVVTNIASGGSAFAASGGIGGTNPAVTNAGSGNGHNNMQPYFVGNWMLKL